MPCICEFGGVKIYLYYEDHLPPHIHAISAGQEIQLAIETQKVLAGRFPKNKLQEVIAWTHLRSAELLANWDLAQAGKKPSKVAPPR